MIALCPLHHKQVDGGLWSNKQFKEFKKNPFVDEKIKVQWPWTPENIVIKFGRNLVVGGGSPIRFRNQPIFEFFPQKIDNLDIQQVSFQSCIKTSQNKTWIKINRNVFEISLIDTTNLIFSPQTKEFCAKHNDKTFIKLKYHKFRFDEFISKAEKFMQNGKTFKNLDKSLENTGSVDSDGNINMVEIFGHFKTPDLELWLKDNELRTKFAFNNEIIPISGWIVNKRNYAEISITSKRNNNTNILTLG